MKFFTHILLACALCAGTAAPAAAQAPKTVVLPSRPELRLLDAPPPPGLEEAETKTALLRTNYRIVLQAAAGGRVLGELAVNTCSAAFELSGPLTPPTGTDPTTTDLSLRGELAEEEGEGLTLRLGYSLTATSYVPSQALGQAGAVRPPVVTHTVKRNGATGMLRQLWPGRSCELMQISGVVYTLSITPETWPAPKSANTQKQAATEPTPGARKPEAAVKDAGPSPETRTRYEHLSEDARKRFREAVREVFSNAEFRNAPEEERRAAISKILSKVEAEEKAKAK